MSTSIIVRGNHSLLQMRKTIFTKRLVYEWTPSSSPFCRLECVCHAMNNRWRATCSTCKRLKWMSELFAHNEDGSFLVGQFEVQERKHPRRRSLRHCLAKRLFLRHAHCTLFQISLKLTVKFSMSCVCVSWTELNRSFHLRNGCSLLPLRYWNWGMNNEPWHWKALMVTFTLVFRSSHFALFYSSDLLVKTLSRVQEVVQCRKRRENGQRPPSCLLQFMALEPWRVQHHLL